MSNQGTVYLKQLKNNLKNKQKRKHILNVTFSDCVRKKENKTKQNEPRK